MAFNASEHARIAALTRVANEPSGEAMTQAARNAYRDSFNVQHIGCRFGCPDMVIDQDLPQKERARMGQAAYKAHMARLGHRRGIIQRQARAARQQARQVNAELKRLDDAI